MSELSDYFSDEELKCPKSDVVQLDPHFKRALVIYRETVNFPLYVNSCCRSWEHNHEIGGANRSYHLYDGVSDGREGTLAIDLRVQNDRKRVIMVKDALLLGWSVGVYRSFIHIDRRVDLGEEQVLFWGRY